MFIIAWQNDSGIREMRMFIKCEIEVVVLRFMLGREESKAWRELLALRSSVEPRDWKLCTSPVEDVNTFGNCCAL